MGCIEGYSKKSEASRRRHAKRGERHEHDQRRILTDATGSMAAVSCYEAKPLQLLRLHDGYCYVSMAKATGGLWLGRLPRGLDGFGAATRAMAKATGGLWLLSCKEGYG
jgi:hypothetical protein